MEKVEQLTLQGIYDICIRCKQKGFNLAEIQVYLGDDDELNGVHNGWFAELITSKRGFSEDNDIILDLIEEGQTSELKQKGILIS